MAGLIQKMVTGGTNRMKSEENTCNSDTDIRVSYFTRDDIIGYCGIRDEYAWGQATADVINKTVHSQESVEVFLNTGERYLLLPGDFRYPKSFLDRLMVLKGYFYDKKQKSWVRF